MRNIDGQTVLSASDLMRFAGCHHATALDLSHLRGDGPVPKKSNEEAKLLQKLGKEHEAAYLASLKSSGANVVEITSSGDLARDAAATREALSGGPDVVYQGAFFSGNWGGWSDFLRRVEVTSNLGAFSYEVVDTKLKSRAHPKHLLQLAVYSDMLAEVQGTVPATAHVRLGNQTEKSFPLETFKHYARLAKERLEAFVAAPQLTKPVPCADCAFCQWSDHCNSVLKDEDSLFNVAGITRSQVKKLEASGVTTMETLASSVGSVSSMENTTLERLITQARLQHARKTGDPRFELRHTESDKGFNLLPKPDPGDVFYDIEGDPHYEDGLEYLHGLWFDGEFQALWAHDAAAEAKAFVDLMKFFRNRLKQYPDARIYHYAPYEIKALRHLAMKHGEEEVFLDRLLRERRFVDLFAVVRGGLFASESDYTLKTMEVFYGPGRTGEVVTAGGSVVAYERWRETREQAILDEIENYNRADCESTEMLRNWLVSIRPEGMPWPFLTDDVTDTATPEEKALAEQEWINDRKAVLEMSSVSEEQQDMLFNLALFHRREAKPAQWAVFDSAGKDEDELIEDFNALGGLQEMGDPWQVKRSMARIYHFPPQETKVRAGATPTIPSPDGPPAKVTVEEMDLEDCKITLKIGQARADLLSDRLTLHPSWPLNTDGIAEAVMDVIKDQCGPRRYRAVDDLLSARKPRFVESNGDILAKTDFEGDNYDVFANMDETTLPIQGPPGAGKTYITVKAILSLVRGGHRVAVSSNSHKAIQNVLVGCLEASDGDDLSLAHKISREFEGYPDKCDIHLTTKNDDPILETSEIVGGTAFFFCRAEHIQKFDWLFVDEAGQVSLANMVAIGRAARNIVLVGDPRQLPQVIQGNHPRPANLSCLEWMLAEHATVPRNRGIFLPMTRRMHPRVCEYISRQVYEDRLESHEDAAKQKVGCTAWPEVGAFWIPCNHTGNSQAAEEEVAAIRRAIDDLMCGTWTNNEGITRPMRASDVIVVAPYNAQVNALRTHLPESIQIGTVDKFQGREAPVCLVSMTASSAEEIPRGMDFLFSLNRINVAVSRAKALALVFGSDRLREAKCETVDQMKLVNTLCALPAHIHVE